MLSCKEATQLASKRLDHPLSFKEKLGLKLHLIICSLCRAYVKQINFIRRIGQRVDSHIESQTQHCLSEEAKTRIKQKMEQ